MASIVITFSGVWSAADLDINRADVRDNLQRIQRFLDGLQNGTYSAANLWIGASATNAVQASAEVTATSSGSLGTVINGTTVTTTFATDAEGTATAAVADVNANATVNKLVKATKSGTGKFVVTANVPGIGGNTCTLTVTGTGASATGSGKLISGAGNDGQPTLQTGLA